MTGWDAFYDKAESRGPSVLLSRAIKLVHNQTGTRQAVDLGCGAGIEAQQLMQSGWDVLAIDHEPAAIARTLTNCSGPQVGTLTTCLSAFEQLPKLPGSSLIHAGLALPFCHPTGFKHLWGQVLEALEPGGVFVGHFFGRLHGWSALAHLTFHTEQQIREMCEGLEIMLLRETHTSTAAQPAPLNWHRFDLIARRPSHP